MDVVEKNRLATRFLMKHMPSMLNGDYWEEMEKYYQELRDNANPDGSYRSTKYRTLAQDFFESEGVENVREMVSYVFGVGKHRFWCFEHNIIDVPMRNFETIFDIVDALENIQVELVGESYEKNTTSYNLWCAKSEPFENIIINSGDFIVGMERTYDIRSDIDEVCNTKDDHVGEITLDSDGRYIDTRYWDDEIDSIVCRRMKRNRDVICYDDTQRIIEYLMEKFPNTVFISESDDIVHYTFVNSEDAKKVRLNHFTEDIQTFNVRYEDIMDHVNDSPLLDELHKEQQDYFKKVYRETYDIVKQELDDGIVEFPQKTMDVYFK